MARLPVVKAREALRALQKAGFTIDHHTGSHAILYKKGHPNPISLPIHPGDLRLGTLRRIIRDAGLTVEEFQDLI